MIKLKPIAQQVLNEATTQPTWGEVKQVFSAIVGKQNKSDAVSALKSLGGIGLDIAASATGISLITKSIEAVGQISTTLDAAKALFSLGKSLSNEELKNPKASEFKQLTGPFWEAVKLSPEVSILLDDKIEQQFINQVILPKLKTPGNDSEPIPNMDEELGKWLNNMGLKKNADIHFTGKTGEI